MSIVCKNTPRLELTWLSSFWGTGTGTELQLECGAYNIQTLLLAVRELLVFICIQLHRFGEHLVSGTCEWKAIWQLGGAVSPFGNNLTVFGFQFQHIPCVICVLRSCHQQVAVFLWPATALWSASIWKPLRCILHSDCHSSLAGSKGALNKDAAVYLSPPEVPVRCINFRRY